MILETWAVTLTKPGRESLHVTVRDGALAPMLLRPLLYRNAGVIIEEYAVMSADPATRLASASFVRIRRSNELARHFDPARLR